MYLEAKRSIGGVRVTYEELINLVASNEGFDVGYTINNLSVKEVFYNKYIANSNEWFNWSDIADDSSIEEVKGIIKGGDKIEK